jgi:hypothetical protein
MAFLKRAVKSDNQDVLSDIYFFAAIANLWVHSRGNQTSDGCDRRRS